MNLLKQKVYPNNMKKNILDSIYRGGGGAGTYIDWCITGTRKLYLTITNW